MNGKFVGIVCVFALILMIVSVALDDLFAKRVPAHMLRFPRYMTVAGIVTPAFCVWLIIEMLHAGDWEEAKLFYLLFGIPFFSLLGAVGILMLLHAINWGIDIKEDRIVYRNAFRHTRTIYFTEITGVEHRNPRFGHKREQRQYQSKDWIRDWVIEFIASKSISSYCIYIGKKSVKVDSIVYNYNGSAARILKAMKKQRIICPVTTKKTWFS